jgi:hypothetical protein
MKAWSEGAATRLRWSARAAGLIGAVALVIGWAWPDDLHRAERAGAGHRVGRIHGADVRVSHRDRDVDAGRDVSGRKVPLECGHTLRAGPGGGRTKPVVVSAAREGSRRSADTDGDERESAVWRGGCATAGPRGSRPYNQM